MFHMKHFSFFCQPKSVGYIEDIVQTSQLNWDVFSYIKYRGFL